MVMRVTLRPTCPFCHGHLGFLARLRRVSGACFPGAMPRERHPNPPRMPRYSPVAGSRLPSVLGRHGDASKLGTRSRRLRSCTARVPGAR